MEYFMVKKIEVSVGIVFVCTRWIMYMCISLY